MKNGRKILLLCIVFAVLAGIYIPIMLVKPSAAYPNPKEPKLGLDLGGGTSLTLQAVGDTTKDQMNKAREIISRRVNALGLTEPVVQVQGNNRILVEMPGESNPDRLISVIGSTAQLQFRKVEQVINPGTAEYDSTPITDTNLTDQQALENLKNSEIVLEFSPNGSTSSQPEKIKLGPTLLTGDIIKDATAQVDQKNGGYEISFTLTDVAAPQFEQVTQSLIGQQLAIVLDYKVESAPRVDSAISGGSGVITGTFTQQQAKDLALVLKLGALPVQFQPEPIRKEVISPTLGRDSLNKGLIAGLVGLVVVALFMLIFYRGLGVVSVLALLIFAALIYGIMVALGHLAGSTLTLAGIAGIIVSIGISADSSVVYFERLKEEMRDGSSLRSCADRAFKNSFRTVIAADFVTFAAALILYVLAIGAVKGFAFTLGISTILDVCINYCFTHPAVALLSRLKIYNRLPFVGVNPRTVREEA